VDCILETITKALKKGDTVTLVGFGTFRSPSARPARGATPRPAKRSRSPRQGPEVSWPQIPEGCAEVDLARLRPRLNTGGAAAMSRPPRTRSAGC